MSAYESTRVERSFERRRCPHCGSGLFKQLRKTANPDLRRCERCHLVFDLYKEGVQPRPKPKKPEATKSGVKGLPREREFKPLRRNPFELWDLAMEIRR